MLGLVYVVYTELLDQLPYRVVVVNDNRINESGVLFASNRGATTPRPGARERSRQLLNCQHVCDRMTSPVSCCSRHSVSGTELIARQLVARGEGRTRASRSLHVLVISGSRAKAGPPAGGVGMSLARSAQAGAACHKTSSLPFPQAPDEEDRCLVPSSQTIYPPANQPSTIEHGLQQLVRQRARAIVGPGLALADAPGGGRGRVR